MIDGVIVSPRRIIPDDRGKVMHAMKATDPEFEKFGEAYFSTIFPGIVKGWHLHKEMIINYVVPVGMIKLVVYDDREGSRTKGELNEFYIGQDNYQLVKVPPFLWNGFACVGPTPALVLNVASIPHDPGEIVRLDPHKSHIPYDWTVKDR
ncbi:MAG: dTDP-4-dehydrorhamnose 3,5-epimerase family protein [Myxococcota bacterium]|jgi:dTDP-4-dehydrorhamnose 3,5-epimerase